MIDMKIPKEINKYEVKTVGIFTTRQTIALAIALPLAVLAWKLTNITLLCMLIGVPAFLYGWYKPYGMYFEDFLRTAFISTVLSPKYRKYKTENFYEPIQKQILQEEVEITDNGSKKKTKKVKYKKSKMAIK